MKYKEEVDVRTNIKKIGKQKNMKRYQDELQADGIDWHNPD